MNVRVPPVSRMSDDTLIKHFELRHGNDLSMKSVPAIPEGDSKRLNDPHVWRTYHQKVHEMRSEDYDHAHNEE